VVLAGVAVLLAARDGAHRTFVVLGALLTTAGVHELARAIVARAAGRSVRLELGLAGPKADVIGAPLGGSARIAFAFAGSLANGLTCTLLLLASARSEAAFGLQHASIGTFAVCQGAWSVLHLLPAAPFHAGEAIVSRSAAARVFLACAAAGMAAGSAFLSTTVLRAPILGVVFAAAALLCARAAGQAARESSDARVGIDERLRAAERALGAGSMEEAETCAREVLDRARSPSHRTRAWTILAWSALAELDAPRALAAMMQLPEDRVELVLLASYLECVEDDASLLELLEDARAAGHRDTFATKMLIDAHLRADHRARVVEIAAADAALLSEDDMRRVVAAVAPGEPFPTALARTTTSI
jgi:hypothetical protein